MDRRQMYRHPAPYHPEPAHQRPRYEPTPRLPPAHPNYPEYPQPTCNHVPYPSHPQPAPQSSHYYPSYALEPTYRQPSYAPEQAYRQPSYPPEPTYHQPSGYYHPAPPVFHEQDHDYRQTTTASGPSFGKPPLAMNALLSSEVVDDETRRKIQDLLRGSVRRIVPLGTIPRANDYDPLHHIDEPARVRPYHTSTTSANAVETPASTSPFWQSSTPRKPPSIVTQRSTTPATPRPHTAKRVKRDQRKGGDEQRNDREQGEGDERVGGEKQVEGDKRGQADERMEGNQRVGDQDANETTHEQAHPKDNDVPATTNGATHKDNDAQLAQLKTPTRATTRNPSVAESERDVDDDTIEVARCAPASPFLLDTPSSRIPHITFRSRGSTKRKHVAEDEVGDTDSDEEMPSEMTEGHGLMVMDDTELGGFGDDFDEDEELEDKSDGDESLIVQKQGAAGKPTKSNKLARANRILSHPDRLLLTGDDQCECCQKAPRVKKECWIISTGGPGKCAPCARAGVTCSLLTLATLEAYKNETKPAVKTAAAKEQETFRRRLGEIEGYARTIQTLVGTYTGDSQEAANYAMKTIAVLAEKVSTGINGVLETAYES